MSVVHDYSALVVHDLAAIDTGQFSLTRILPNASFL